MTAARVCVALVVLAAMAAASACGRKSGLDTPYEAAVQARKDAQKAGEPLPPEPEKPVERQAVHPRPAALGPLSLTSCPASPNERNAVRLPPMNHFHYRDGVLHAEDVAIPDIAAAVGTPFYCYSTATLTRHYTVFSERLRRPRLACLLRPEGELQPGCAEGAGEARRRRRRGVGRRDAARARRRHSGAKRSCFRASARRRGKWISRSWPASSASTSNPSRSWSFCRRAPRRSAGPRRFRCASTPTSTPRPTGRSRPARPRTSSAFRGGGRARSMRGRPGCRASASPASTRISAAR